jgi:hypothetical protein
MKNTFTSTVTFRNAEELANYINAVGHLVQSINIVTTPDNPTVVQAAAPRPMRASKVNDTIVSSLQQRAMSAKELKEALESAGLAAGSLSTGLAALQKNRTIERVGEGLYGLVGYRQAAE